MTYHIAQLNIARMRAPLTDPLMGRFVALLEPINRLAERSAGFQWRLQTAEGDATTIRAFDDEQLLVNLSVWDSIEALREFVFATDHAVVMRERTAWFAPMRESTTVLWWVPAGHEPTVDEARARLEQLQRDGATPEAFTFARRYPPPASGGE